LNTALNTLVYPLLQIIYIIHYIFVGRESRT